MDKKLKFWNSFRKWILLGWILWILSIMYWFNTGSEGVFDWSAGFNIAWPALFFVLLFWSYYKTNQIYEKEYNKDKKQELKKNINLIVDIKTIVIILDILWFLRMIIPSLSVAFCLNCYYLLHYIKILIIIANIYFLIGPEKISKLILSLLKINKK